MMAFGTTSTGRATIIMSAQLGLFNHLTIHKTTKPAAYHGKVTPLLVKAIQEQQATIEAQQIQIDELKKMVEILMRKQDPAKVKQLK